MEKLENVVTQYRILKKWKGEKEAVKFLKPYAWPNYQGAICMVLFKKGIFEHIGPDLTVLDSVPDKFREFFWVIKMASQLANKKSSDEIDKRFYEHYASQSNFRYHSIGRFLMGLISEDTLLGKVKNKKELCEVAYWIGFSYRMKGDFSKASQWYQFCRETGETNMGEFHWASDEMSRWANLGITNQHKYIRDDIDEYYKRY